MNEEFDNFEDFFKAKQKENNDEPVKGKDETENT